MSLRAVLEDIVADGESGAAEDAKVWNRSNDTLWTSVSVVGRGCEYNPGRNS